jgi:cyclic beta-1,2-glucan synthetase
LERWAEIVKDEQPEVSAQWKKRAEALSISVEQSSWDGDWYLRAYFDDGTPLGSHSNREARIDSLAQSWAVLSGAGDPDRARRAMECGARSGQGVGGPP